MDISTDRPVWYGQDGKHYVTDMATSHLFFVIRMIWNHSCPPHLQLRPFRLYDIRLPPDYLAEIAPVIYDELLRRSDLAQHLQRQLDFMRSNWLQELRPLGHVLQGLPPGPDTAARG